MACFWSLYKHYRENLQIKNCITDLKRKDPKTIIKLLCNEKDIDVKKEVSVLNELYDKYNIVNYGFDRFFVTKIISMKKNYDSIYLFVSNRL